ncbi:sperm-associated microtubule inner protein 4 [Gastrophryne carolinensis]
MAVQYNLCHYYRQKEGTQELSPTLLSSELWTPLQTPQRPTVSAERFREYHSSTPAAPRLPWGREREYGGIGAVSLPSDHRPKTEPPPQEAKGHKHYGYGGDPWPRGLPIQQYYDVTKLRKSAVRDSDDLYPKPPAASLSEKQIEAGFPAEHPYYSHISRFAVFPSFQPAEEPARSSTPIHSQTPACGHPTIVLRKTKGNPYRHEIIVIPSDSQKVALTWPGQQGYSHFPKFHHENNQIYYPCPPKTVAPNPLYKSYEETPTERTTNLQRNIIKSQWLTTYNRNFTENGEMNPLKLDNYHEKVIGNMNGRTDENTGLKPVFLSTVLPARPLEGRIARLREGRRPLLVDEEAGSETEDSIPNVNGELDIDLKLCCTPKTKVEIGNAYQPKKGNADYLPSTPVYKESDIRKITDTEKTDALYRRQLMLSHNPEVKPIHDDLQPNEKNCYDFQNASGLSNPFIKNDTQEVCYPNPNEKHSVASPHNNIQTSRQGIIYPPRKTLSRASLLELQDSFSRSEAYKTFHHNFPEKTKDLRDNCYSGRKHNFYGFNSFYFYN